jgi:hypothetical protein
MQISHSITPDLKALSDVHCKLRIRHRIKQHSSGRAQQA